MTDKLTPERRSENMRRIRAKHTSPEIVVRRLIHKMGYRYRLHSPKLPGKPDLVFQRLKKIIEVKGCFWHQHEGCIDSHIPKTRREYWRPKLKRNRKRDEENGRKLKTLGWQVFELWECELRDLKRVSKRLERFLGSRQVDGNARS